MIKVNELEYLINKFNNLEYEHIKQLYPYTKILIINQLYDYINNYEHNIKLDHIILLILNSDYEKSGHYIVFDGQNIEIFDPLGINGLIKFPNCDEKTKNLLMNIGNKISIQNIDSTCCGLLCLLYVYLNNICYCPVNKFNSIIQNARNSNKNIIKYLINLIKIIKK